MRRWLAVLLIAAALLTTACARRQPPSALPPLDGSALADPGLPGARYALDRYLQARMALDYPAVYAVLTPRTQQAYTLEDLRAFFKDYLGYSAGPVAGLEELPDRWVRFAVRPVRWHLKGRPPAEGDAWYISVHYEGDRWGVALADPLTDKAGAASEAGDLEALDRVAEAMLAIDPYSFRAHIQKSYVHLYGGDANAALGELRKAAAYVPPSAAPEVLWPMADLYRLAEQPQRAAELYRLAIEGMNRYEGLYDNGLTAALNRQLALAALAAGDLATARRATVFAQLQSPFDGRHHALAAALVTR